MGEIAGIGPRVSPSSPIRWLAAAALWASLPAVGCQVELDRESLEGTAIGRAKARCSVTPAPGVDRGGAFSLAFEQGSYWIFGETWQTEARMTRIIGSSAATLASGADPCMGLSDVRSKSGELALVIPFTTEEAAENAARTDGRRIALWPVSGFSRGDTGYVYFRKVALEDYFDVVEVGVGVARVRFGEPAERSMPGKYAAEPSLLWLFPQHDWGRSAFVGADGLAYLYGCHQRAAWEHACRIARVEPERAAEPDAYRYFDGSDWVTEPERAASVLEDVPAPSVAHNPELGGVLAVHAGFLENRVFARTAPLPEGPFGDRDHLFTGTAPASFWIRDVVQHPALASADGRRVLVSYHTSPANEPAGMRLVDVTLE